MKIKGSILLVASSLLLSVPAIGATDFNAMLKTFAGIVRSYDDLDSRRMQLSVEVDKALKAGQISAEEAAAFKSDLASIEQRATQMKSSGRRFGFTQQLLFTNEMSILTNRLSQAVAAKSTNTPVLTAQSLEAAQADLSNKISQAQASGKLNQADADRLRQDLKHVSDIKQAFLSSSADGNLTAKQIELLNSELEKVRASVEEQIKQTDSAVPQLNERRNNLQSKVNNAESNRKISSDLARQLRSELQQAADMQNSFLSDGALSGAEILKVASELDRMETRIDQALQSSAASVPAAVPVQTAPVSSGGSIPMPSFNANRYTDIQSYWGAPYVAILGDKGVIGGFPDGSFKPNDPITRSQFAAIAVRALGLPASNSVANFQDVPARHWANSAIAAVSASGLVTGFPDGTFRPEDKITRTQALVILAKALPASQADKSALNSFSDAASVPAWAYASVLKAADSGIIVNYPDPNMIRAGDNATRGEVAALMYRTLQNLGQNLPLLSVGLPQYVVSRLAGTQQQMPPTAPAVGGSASTSVQTAPPPPPPPPPPSPSSTDKIYLFNVSVQAPAQARGGDVITVSAIGTPKGKAVLTISGLVDKMTMNEVRDGVYEANYTVRRADNVGTAKVSVSLSKDALSPVSMDYAALLSADAKEPEITSLQPSSGSISRDRLTSIVATFNDGSGSGINLQSVKLIVNGQDVSSAATIGEGFVTYKPMQPFVTPKVDLELSVADKAGNLAGQKWSFSFDRPYQAPTGSP